MAPLAVVIHITAAVARTQHVSELGLKSLSNHIQNETYTVNHVHSDLPGGVHSFLTVLCGLGHVEKKISRRWKPLLSRLAKLSGKSVILSENVLTGSSKRQTK